MEAPSLEHAYEFFAVERARLGYDGTPLAWASLQRRVNALASCYGFLCKLNKALNNPWIQLREAIAKKGPQKFQHRMLSEDEAIALLDAPSAHTKVGIRDRALLAVFFGGGLRRSEVHRLNIGDFMVSPQGIVYLYLKVTKTGGNETQSLPEWAIERVSNLIIQRKAEGAKNEDPLFMSYFYQNGAPRARLSKKYMNTIFKMYGEELGIVKVTTHCARATFASTLKAKGYDDRDVALALRHKTISMVQVYDKRAHGMAENPGRNLVYSKKRVAGGE